MYSLSVCTYDETDAEDAQLFAFVVCAQIGSIIFHLIYSNLKCIYEPFRRSSEPTTITTPARFSFSEKMRRSLFCSPICVALLRPAYSPFAIRTVVVCAAKQFREKRPSHAPVLFARTQQICTSKMLSICTGYDVKVREDG